MKLYLVRHGDAVQKTVDSKRPLSEKGIMEVSSVAHYMALKNDTKPVQIVNSGKLRAKQTAEILARHLHYNAALDEDNALEPMEDTSIWADRLDKLDQDTMLVGHLPYLGKLVSLLLYRDENAKEVFFQPAAVVCLEKTDVNKWDLKCSLSPEMVRSKKQ